VIKRCLPNVAATRSLAGAIASVARVGDLVVLAGEMGAGKTAFVQGFAAALEVTEPVTSPTFTLVHTYDGRLRVHHLDVYRLERLSELAELAVDELLDDGVVLVEWGDAVADALPAAFLQVDLAFGDEPDQRVAVLSERGARWSSRLRTIEAATDAFAC